MELKKQLYTTSPIFPYSSVGSILRWQGSWNMVNKTDCWQIEHASIDNYLVASAAWQITTYPLHLNKLSFQKFQLRWQYTRWTKMESVRISQSLEIKAPRDIVTKIIWLETFVLTLIRTNNCCWQITKQTRKKPTLYSLEEKRWASKSHTPGTLN